MFRGEDMLQVYKVLSPVEPLGYYVHVRSEYRLEPGASVV